MKVRNLVLFAFLTLAVLFTLGCPAAGSGGGDEGGTSGYDDGDPSKISFIGSLGSTVTAGGGLMQTLSGAGSFTDYKVVLFFPGEEKEDLTWTEYPVSAEGTFEYSVPKGTFFVPCLVDTSDAESPFAGVVGMPTDATATEFWEAIDSGNLEWDVDLGTVRSLTETGLSDVLAAETTVNDISAGITDLEQAMRQAMLDDIGRLYKNFVNTSYNLYTLFPMQFIHQEFSEGVNEGDRDLVESISEDGDLQPDEYGFWGYTPAIMATQDYGKYPALVPPESVRMVHGDGAYNESFEDIILPEGIIEGERQSDEPGWEDYVPFTTLNDGAITYEFAYAFASVSSPIRDIPAGETPWILENESGDSVASLDFRAAIPQDTQGRIKLPIPRLKANLKAGSDDEIESFSITWYLRDGSDGYQRATEGDLEVIEQMISNLTLEIDDNSLADGCEEYEEEFHHDLPIDNIIVQPDLQWRYPPDGQKPDDLRDRVYDSEIGSYLTYFNVSYYLGGMIISFVGGWS